jgi:hypothetical protein
VDLFLLGNDRIQFCDFVDSVGIFVLNKNKEFVLLLLLLFTEIEFSLGGSSPDTSNK